MKSLHVIVGLVALLLAGCAGFVPFGSSSSGITWAPGSFESLGEQIYFTAIDADGNRIAYSGGPATGMMMGGYLVCASCHGPDARGGRHVMHMEVMDAPDIRWSALTDHARDEGEIGPTDEYSLDAFRRAVIDGQHPDGDELSSDMPRWRASDASLKALEAYLKSLD